MNEQMELLAEFAFASPVGAKRYALRDIVSPTKYYEGRIVAFGDLDREISIVPGEFRLSGFSLDVDNSDNEFSNFKSQVAFKNVEVTLLYGDLAVGEADFTTVAKGVIDTWSMGDIWSFDILDESMDRLDQPISGVITKNLFPDLPDSTPLNLIPLVIGTVSSSGLFADGALPAYLIDPAVSQSKYQYVAARGTIKEVTTVYKYGVVVASGFTVQQRTFGATTITTIEFDADQRDTSRPNEREVTWDGQGITDDGTPSGNNITNPSMAYKEVFLQEGYTAAELDTTGFDDARDILNIRNVTCGIAIVDKEETLRTVAEKCAESFNMTTITSLAGKISVTVPQPGATVPAAPLIDESQIVSNSFGMDPSDELASSLEYEFSCHWVQNEFQDRLEQTDSAQQSKIGNDIRKKAELWYVIHPTSASAVSNDKLFFTREERVVMAISADPVLFKTIKLGSDVRLTHFSGLGSSGFSAQLCRVISAGLTFDGFNILSQFRLVDLTEASFNFTTDYQQFGNEQPPFYTNWLNTKDQPTEAPILNNAA